MEDLIIKILPAIIVINMILSAMSAALEKIVDKTEALKGTDKDNKLYAIVGTLASYTQKIVDFFSANRAH